MSVRLPSAEGLHATGREGASQAVLPGAAPTATAPPAPLARGAPAEGYLWSWSVYQWPDGEAASVQHSADLSLFAAALAQFLGALLWGQAMLRFAPLKEEADADYGAQAMAEAGR
jgi:hypothetical protein